MESQSEQSNDAEKQANGTTAQTVRQDLLKGRGRHRANDRAGGKRENK